jgi:NifU-like protein involved in Fe-S cluster formation
MPRRLAEEEIRLLKQSGYSEKSIKLYIDKVNMGVISKPDIVETHVGPCGDVIELYLRIGKNNVIEDAKFHYLGCPGSAAAASALTELIKDKTVNKAKKLTTSDILKQLGGLPKPKLDCPKLVITALRKAISEYEKRKGRSNA